jgi:AcrR family transcriptional regulator
MDKIAPAVANAIPSRAERTRHALLMAGLDLLVTRPIDAIPIDDIVAAAGVAKGSFFNHFCDKQAFGAAVAGFVRAGLERRVDAMNAGVDNPVERLANGMVVAADFAFFDASNAIVMLRGMTDATMAANPLNQGVEADMARCVAAGFTRPEARSSGVIYWLGLCQILMIAIIEANFSRPAMLERLHDMLLLGLGGLGVAPEVAADMAARSSRNRLNADVHPALPAAASTLR